MNKPVTKPHVGAARASARGIACALFVVATASAIGWPLYHRVGIANTNVLMLYLVGVLWIAATFDRVAAVVASVFAVLAFDFLFVPPYYTLTVHDQQYLVTFAGMLITALLISTLTHRVRMQAENVREAWERAEAEFLRNTLLSGISHELRTPLASITGAASALNEAGESLSMDQKRELLETIAGESERMERLIHKLLDMTRVESGGLVLNKQWQPLQEPLGAALHHLDRRLKGREVRIDLPADLPMVQFDAIGIEQVMANLIENALEHTPTSGVIDVSARAANGEVMVEIADRGPGLPTGMERRVFEKFFRVRPKEASAGIGLGLAICKGIIEAHGGQISATNRAGGGAAFRFTLPRSDSPPFVDATQ
jgi:two-component system sensor histidine kinase KdpD